MDHPSILNSTRSDVTARTTESHPTPTTTTTTAELVTTTTTTTPVNPNASSDTSIISVNKRQKLEDDGNVVMIKSEFNDIEMVLDEKLQFIEELPNTTDHDRKISVQQYMVYLRNLQPPPIDHHHHQEQQQQQQQQQQQRTITTIVQKVIFHMNEMEVPETMNQPDMYQTLAHDLLERFDDQTNGTVCLHQIWETRESRCRIFDSKYFVEDSFR
jgi:hypothetical protein